MIKLYNQLLQEMTARFSNVRKSDEGLIGRSPRTKEEEQDLLKVNLQNLFNFFLQYTHIIIIETNTRCSSTIKDRATTNYFSLVRSCEKK